MCSRVQRSQPFNPAELFRVSISNPRCTAHVSVSPSHRPIIDAAQEATKVMVRDVDIVVADIGAWVVPLGTPLAYQVGLPLYATFPLTTCTTNQYMDEKSDWMADREKGINTP